MALLADRKIDVDEISFVSEAEATAGQIMVYKGTQGSGIGVGQGINDSAPIAIAGPGTPTSTSKPCGLLLTNVVSLDQTIYRRNPQKTEQVIGEPMYMVKHGYVWTNSITGTPAAGDPAYMSTSGTVSATQVSGAPLVGRFRTSKDSNGYAKLDVEII